MNISGSGPKHFELYIKVLSQTLSKVFDKFRKTLVISNYGFASNTFHISCDIDNSWLTQELKSEIPADYYSKDPFHVSI